MQAFCLSDRRRAYILLMQTGRPSKRLRPAFGERLHALREHAGLSQEQMAERLGLSQRAYSHWERDLVALRPDQLFKLAQALNVPIEELFGSDTAKRKGGGPAGKMRLVFEAASNLPRTQQQKLLAVVEAFVAQHSNGHKQAA